MHWVVHDSPFLDHGSWRVKSLSWAHMTRHLYDIFENCTGGRVSFVHNHRKGGAIPQARSFLLSAQQVFCPAGSLDKGSKYFRTPMGGTSRPGLTSLCTNCLRHAGLPPPFFYGWGLSLLVHEPIDILSLRQIGPKSDGVWLQDSFVLFIRETLSLQTLCFFKDYRLLMGQCRICYPSGWLPLFRRVLLRSVYGSEEGGSSSQPGPQGPAFLFEVTEVQNRIHPISGGLPSSRDLLAFVNITDAYLCVSICAGYNSSYALWGSAMPVYWAFLWPDFRQPPWFLPRCWPQFEHC